MRNILLTAVVCFTTLSFAIAQKTAEFGELTVEEFKFPVAVQDTSVGAVILYEKGKTTYDHEFEILFTVHRRILVLDNTEFDEATVKIPYFKEGYVSKIKAAAYQLKDGEIVEFKLNKKDIFTEEINEDRRVKRFTIPNVTEGSVIEYSYQVGSKRYYRLNKWYFQHRIPTLYSEYVVSMPSFFNYRQNLSGILPLKDYTVEAENARLWSYSFSNVKKTFIAEDMPAFKEESFITNADNYISKIQFDLIDYTWPNSATKVVNPDNYEALSLKLADQIYFSDIYKGNGFLKDDLELILSDSMTDLEKAKAIFSFVQRNFTFDRTEYYNDIKKAYKARKGDREDINAILTAMLVKANLEAYLVLVSEKSNGKLNMYYPTRNNFNSGISAVFIDNKRYLLDASRPYLSFNLLSPNTINDKGLYVSAVKTGLLDIEFNDFHSEQTIMNVAVDSTGALTGTVASKSTGYAAYSLLSKHEADIDNYKEAFSKSLKKWEVLEHEVTVADDYKITERVSLTTTSGSFAELGTDVGDMIIFNPILFNKIIDNPYVEEERQLPVTLYKPINILTNFNIQIPEGYEVTELPKSVSLVLPNNHAVFNYSCQQLGRSINVVSVLKIIETEYTAQEYYDLKEFRARIIEKHKEEVVLKKVGGNE